MGKSPFERILSRVERRKLLLSLVSSKEPVLCRLDDGVEALFIVEQVAADLSVSGNLYTRGRVQGLSRRIIASFQVERNSYFVSTHMQLVRNQWTLKYSADFFMLNRRRHVRTEIPGFYELHFELVGQTFSPNISLVEMSASGARIAWKSLVPLRAGDRFSARLRDKKGRAIHVHAEIKHTLGTHIYGVEFVEATQFQNTRLRQLSAELQRSVYLVEGA